MVCGSVFLHYEYEKDNLYTLSPYVGARGMSSRD